MMQTPSSPNVNAVRNFLRRQLEIWTPAIVQAITRQTDLRTLVCETIINGRSLGQIFGNESVNRFLNDARLQLMQLIWFQRYGSFQHCLFKGLHVKNFNDMQLALAMADCMDLYRMATIHFTENEQFYRRLLQSLRLLVSNREEILIVALSIGNRIEHRAIYFSEYINVDHSTWVTTAITVLGAVYIIGNISFR